MNGTERVLRGGLQEKQPSHETIEEGIRRAKFLEFDYIISNCAYFITDYVYIEDKGNPEGVTRFGLWPMQHDALDLILRNLFIIALKARQIGMTWLVLAYALWMMLRKKGCKIIAISKRDDPDAVELSARMQLMLRYLPKWLIRDEKFTETTGLRYYANTHEVVIERSQGEASKFITLPASADTAHSFTADVMILDEWALHPFANEIWTGAFPTINRPDYSGRIIGLSTGRRGTLFEEIWNDTVAGRNKFARIFLPWWADPRRTPEWYEDSKKVMKTTYRSQYPRNEEDAFSAGEGAFFEEWDNDTHAPYTRWEPEAGSNYAIIGGYDPGFSTNACFKWYAVGSDGNAICFREYYPHRTTDKKQAEDIRSMSVYPGGRPYEFDYIVADSDAWVPSRSSGESTAEVFANNGLNMRTADKDLVNGWRRLHEWLDPFPGKDGLPTALLVFTKECRNTVRCYPGAVQSKTNPDDISKDSEHHPMDVDRYFVMSRPAARYVAVKPKAGGFDEDFEGRDAGYDSSPYS